MKPTKGLLRNAFIIVALAWMILHYLLSNDGFVNDRRLEFFGRVGVVVMSIWGILTLLANRTE